MDEYLPIEEATERFNSKSGWPEDKRIDAERLLVHAIEGGLPLYAIVMRTISTDEIAPRPLYRAGNYAPVHPKAAERVLLSNPSPAAAIREVEVEGKMQPTLEWNMSMGDLRIRAEDIDDLIGMSRNGAPAAPVEVSHGETPNESGESGNKAQAHAKGERWTDDQLRDLLKAHESGKTQQELADAYGMKRQAISAKLKVAREKFSKPKPTPADLSMRAQATKTATFGNQK